MVIPGSFTGAFHLFEYGHKVLLIFGNEKRKKKPKAFIWLKSNILNKGINSGVDLGFVGSEVHTNQGLALRKAIQHMEIKLVTKVSICLK